MGVAHVGLVHRDPCECKVKGFFSMRFPPLRVQCIKEEALARGATFIRRYQTSSHLWKGTWEEEGRIWKVIQKCSSSSFTWIQVDGQ